MNRSLPEFFKNRNVFSPVTLPWSYHRVSRLCSDSGDAHTHHTATTGVWTNLPSLLWLVLLSLSWCDVWCVCAPPLSEAVDASSVPMQLSMSWSLAAHHERWPAVNLHMFVNVNPHHWLLSHAPYSIFPWFFISVPPLPPYFELLWSRTIGSHKKI